MLWNLLTERFPGVRVGLAQELRVAEEGVAHLQHVGEEPEI
jgi:hypothetical protein